MVVTMVAMLCGVVLACTAVALLLNEILFKDVMAHEWQMQLDMTADFVRSRHLPPNVARRIDEYHEYQWTFLRGVNEAAFFSKLPCNLRSEALVALNDSSLRRIPHFTCASNDLIADLAQLLYPQLFLPHEYLHRTGQMASHASLLKRGRVQELPADFLPDAVPMRKWVSLRRKYSAGVPLHTYVEGECLIPDASLGPTRVTADLVAKTFVELHALAFEEVANLLIQRAKRRSKGRAPLPSPPPTSLPGESSQVGGGECLWGDKEEAALIERVKRAKQQAKLCAPTRQDRRQQPDPSCQGPGGLRGFLRRVSGESRFSHSTRKVHHNPAALCSLRAFERESVGMEGGGEVGLERGAEEVAESELTLTRVEPLSPPQCDELATDVSAEEQAQPLLPAPQPSVSLPPASSNSDSYRPLDTTLTEKLHRHTSLRSMGMETTPWSAQLLRHGRPKAYRILITAGLLARLTSIFCLLLALPLRVGFGRYMSGLGWLPLDLFVDLVVGACLFLNPKQPSLSEQPSRRHLLSRALIVCEAS